MVKEVVKSDYCIKEVIVKKELYCDICGKLINSHDYENKEYNPPVGYYELTTGNNDWGNDSIDSIEQKDICSLECLTKEFNEYARRTDNIHCSEYFEVTRTKF